MEDLIEKNMGLVASIVNSFNPKDQTEREDYLQAGRIGLWKALKNFNPAKGNVLSTYAWNPIRWEIIKEIKIMKRKKDHIDLSSINMPAYIEKEKFWEYLPELTDEEKMVLDLRLMEYRFHEICTKMGKSNTYIKKLFYSAIEKIKEQEHGQEKGASC